MKYPPEGLYLDALFRQRRFAKIVINQLIADAATCPELERELLAAFSEIATRHLPSPGACDLRPLLRAAAKRLIEQHREAAA